MALTIAFDKQGRMDRDSVRIGTIAFDSSYAVGGESLTASDLNLRGVSFLLVAPKNGYVFEYDYANRKLKAYYGDNNNASDGPLIEVPNTTNLSTVTGAKFLAFGY